MNTTLHQGAKRHAAKGLALIEVLIAIAILVMMLSALWSSFDSMLQASEATEKVQDRYARVRAALNRMSAEIPHAYLSHNRPPDESRHFTLFDGRRDFDADSLTFSAFVHLRIRKDADESDQSVVQYFLASDPQDSRRTHLYRRESRRLTGDRVEDMQRFASAYVLCEDVALLEFRYWDPQKQEWLPEWSTVRNDAQPDRLPERVKITLGLKDEDNVVEKFSTQTLLIMEEKLDASRG
jgi:general secretion pathway protein J